MDKIEKEFLKNYNPYKYENPSVTVDICICSIIEGILKILLIKRKHPPFRSCWAIPGGFLDVPRKETLDETAARELQEELCLRDIYFEQLKTYGDPNRDPRKRVVTVAYFALVPYGELQQQKIEARDDAKEYGWFPITNLPDLAFDHAKIIKDLLERLRGKISYAPIAFNLVPKRFTWNELQAVYEAVLGYRLVTPNFRRKIKSMYVIQKSSIKMEKRLGRPSCYLTLIRKKQDF